MVNEKLEINHNEMTFLKDMCHEQDSSVHHIENYLNKIVPIKTFGSICNLLHSTIGSQNKGMLNNLIQVEQLKYADLVKENDLLGKEETILKFEYDSLLPKLPVLKEDFTGKNRFNMN